MSAKCITVPKTKEAEKKLEFDNALADELIEYNFNSDEDFYDFCQTNIFEEINNICGSMIADFESDGLTSCESKQKCLQFLEDKKLSVDGKVKAIINEVIKLLKEAIARDTGIYFFF